MNNALIAADGVAHLSILGDGGVTDSNGFWGSKLRVDVERAPTSFQAIEDLRKGTGFERHGIWADPKFVDEANYDFRLRPDSPCRGAGPNGTDIGIPWDADADYFYKLLTTPIEQLIDEAKAATQSPVVPAGGKAAGPDILAEKPAYPGFFVVGAYSVRLSTGLFRKDSEAELGRVKQLLQSLKGLGVNTVMGHPLYAPDEKPHVAMLAKELGMYVASSHEGLASLYESRKPIDASNVRSLLLRDVERLRTLPNAFEYFVRTDAPEPEFRPDVWKPMCDAVAAVDPTRPAHFIYEEAADARPYWEAHPLPSIHYMIYPFQEPRPVHACIRDAIREFNAFGELAPAASHFAWLQTFGGGKYRPHRLPTPAEIRCLTFLALAHGVKGVFFFKSYSQPGLPGLLDTDGRPTSMGDEVKRLSQVIDKLGPVLMRVRKGPNIASVDGNALVTTLVSKVGRQYAFVVNLDVERPAKLQVDIKTAGKSPTGVLDVLEGRRVESQATEGKLRFATRLDAGEGRLFRILHERTSTVLGRLPPAFDKAFMFPDSDKDQHGNPVVERNGRRSDPETGYPYEIWLNLPAAPNAAQAGEPRMEFVLIPAGEFMMGSTEDEIKRLNEKYANLLERRPDWFTCEGPQHLVRLTKPFYLLKYEVTQAQWESAMGSRPWLGKGGVKEHPRHPAAYISWEDCKAFLKKLDRVGGPGFRLPTEAQWEYACRAGSTAAYSFGDDATKLKEYAWYSDNTTARGERYAHAVGMKKPDAWGLYDMHGNVYEWCQDYFGHYSSGTQTDPCGLDTVSSRIDRGGGYGSRALDCRSPARSWNPPQIRLNIGFRVVVELPSRK